MNSAASVMKPKNAKTAFVKYVRAAGEHPEALTLGRGIELMLGFYRDERAEGCAVGDSDEDMLLYQWGASAGRDGEHFSVSIVRQLMWLDPEAAESDDHDEDDDDDADEEDAAIWQLELRFRFPAEPTLLALEAGSRWCDSPAKLEAFQRFITGSAPFVALAARADAQVKLDYFNAE